MRRVLTMAAVFVGIGLLSSKFIFRPSAPKLTVNEDIFEERKQSKKGPTQFAAQKSRKPASRTDLFKPEVREIDKKNAPDLLASAQTPEEEETLLGSSDGGEDNNNQASSLLDSSGGEDFSHDRNRKVAASETSVKENSAADNDIATVSNASPLFNFPSEGVPTTGGTTAGGGTTTGGGTAAGGVVGGSEADTPLTCSVNLGGGNYAFPINLSLTCTGVADIRYCVGVGGLCCDPKVLGVAYSTPFVVGATQGDYCVSFYGDSDPLNKSSVVVQQIYTVNPVLPHMDSLFVQRYFQTTQLSGLNFLQSNEFTKTGYVAGQVNFGTNDVMNPLGLNLSCNDVVEDSILAGTPAHSFATVMAEMNLALVGAASELEIPMRPDHLIYGENNLVTYVTNNNNAAPLYSCSSNKIFLRDFEYFTADAISGVDGTPEAREFSGGFSPYSYTEVDNSALPLGRAPASEVNQEQGGQELRVGLFGIFF